MISKVYVGGLEFNSLGMSVDVCAARADEAAEGDLPPFGSLDGEGGRCGDGRDQLDAGAGGFGDHLEACATGDGHPAALGGLPGEDALADGLVEGGVASDVLSEAEDLSVAGDVLVEVAAQAHAAGLFHAAPEVGAFHRAAPVSLQVQPGAAPEALVAHKEAQLVQHAAALFVQVAVEEFYRFAVVALQEWPPVGAVLLQVALQHSPVIDAHAVQAAGVLFPFFGILLNPIFAAAAMGLSSVTVVSNALRLRRFRPPAVAVNP